MSFGSRARTWLAPPLPLARIAVLRSVIYLFVVADVFLIVDDVIPHASTPGGLYRPLMLRRLLDLPSPNPVYVHLLLAVVVLGSLVAATGRLPRLAGFAVAAAFTDWVSIGFSYSKVDHDHFALIVAVWVLPTVGRAALDSRDRSEAAGWALRCIQLAVVACYFLSAVAKVRFGGWDWVTGATFTWAVVRRGTAVGRLMLHVPFFLVVGQFVVFTLEALSPLLLFLRGRALYAALALYAGFHLMTWISITIHFLPHVVCLAAFLPLERIVARAAARVRRVPSPVAAPPITPEPAS